jgi:GR25 family glycosyltransferase involved in LPS biosynthesis
MNNNEEIKNIPVFCINLKRAKERKRRMVQEWTEKRGIDLIFFDAIDQKDIDINNLQEPFKTNFEKSFSSPLKKIDLSLGEICCSLSHAKILKKIMELGLNEAIVIEDDSEPLFENAEEFFNNLYLYNFDTYQAGIVLLHDQLEEAKKHKVISDDNIFKQNYHNILTSKTTCSQSIYYRNRESMEEAYNAFSLLVNPTDWAWDHFDIAKRGIFGMSVKPMTAHLTDTTYLKSNAGRFFVKNDIKSNLDDYNLFKILASIEKISNESDILDITYNKEDIDLEQYFHSYYNIHKEKFDNIDYHLIPIKWTRIYNDKERKEKILSRLKGELDKLPKNKKYFTVSQHDDAPNLEILPPDTINFSAGGNIDNTIPIPLMSQNKKRSVSQVKVEKKDIFCNFVGALTHPCRKKIFDELSNNQDYAFHIKNKWSSDLYKAEMDLFETVIKRSKFTLCPRGYGTTSFRLYEAMKFGSVPVYISDSFHLPYKDIIDWNDICVLIPTEAIDNIDTILKLITKTKYEKMISNIKKIFPKIFKFEYMFEYILNTLTSNSETYENTKLNKEDNIPTKIFTYCTESHKVFIPWLETIYKVYPNITIDYAYFDQDCPSGVFEEYGYKKTMIKKIQRIIELFDLYPDEKYFIFSDVDIQYFKPFHHITNHLLETHDILFQSDDYSVCMGFIIFKNNNAVKKLFEITLNLLITSDDEKYHDQKAVCDALIEYKDLKYATLSKDFFNFKFYETPSTELWSMKKIISSKLEIPANIIMHHANWIMGIDEKLEMLRFVSKQVNKSKNKKLTIVTALLKGDNFIFKTANSIIPNLVNSDSEWLIKYSEENIPKSLLELSDNNPNIKIIGKSDTSLYDALNQAIYSIDGGYVLVIGAGDTMTEGSIKIIEETIKNNSDADGICFSVNTKYNGFKPDLKDIYKRMPACHQGMVLKTDYIKTIKGFNTRYKIAGDYDLFCRYFQDFPVLISRDERVSTFMGDGLSELSLYECWLETALISYTNWENIFDDRKQLMLDVIERCQTSVKQKGVIRGKQNSMRDEKQYIFHIGLNKSGTNTLNQALNELGIKSCHFADPLINEGKPITYLFEKEIKEGFLDLRKYPFKAYTDINILEKEYEWLYKSFPNAKFILTIRDKEGWLNDRILGFENETSYNKDFREKYIEEWSRLYDDYISDVTHFFSNKSNKLLKINIYNNEGYEKLCPFLGLPIKKEKLQIKE